MKIDLSEFRQAFLQETADHLATMEADLLALRSEPTNVELLNSIFRSAHTIKGGGGLVGYAAVVQFTHSLEGLLNLLREGSLAASEQVIEILLRSVDMVRALSNAAHDAPLPPAALALKAEIDARLNKAVGAASSRPTAPEKTNVEHATRSYTIRFSPHRDLFASGTNPIVLLRNLGDLGTVHSCVLHDSELPELQDLDPESCYLSWSIVLTTSASEAEIREVFEFVEDLADVSIGAADARPAAAERGKDAPAHMQASSAPAQKASPVVKEAGRAHKAESGSESIRVSTKKVDRLIDLVGELVIAHVMTAEMIERFDMACLPKLRDAVAAMERNTRELHEQVMSVRMLPVKTLFQRYPRAVYDIARASGKQIRVEMSGEETEIDRSMLEALGDPLIHLVRNAADHGVETPEQRRALGKPQEGLIALRAFHRSGRVVIEISDDGAGIDIEQVRRKAIEKNLIRADAEMSDEQIRMLIFEPGFSTRDQITDLSGRGVGMDVVRQSIRRLNGALTLVSEKGHGSKITIELPLTLAILEGLLARVADRTLVLPLLSVIETAPLPDNEVKRVAEQGEVIVIRDEPIPLLRLSRYLGLLDETAKSEHDEEERNRRTLAVIVQAGARKVGFVVDELLGQQQVVVKSLEQHLRKVDGLMGATILGDGSVAPILDVCGVAGLDLFGLQTATTEISAR